MRKTNWKLSRTFQWSVTRSATNSHTQSIFTAADLTAFAYRWHGGPKSPGQRPSGSVKGRSNSRDPACDTAMTDPPLLGTTPSIHLITGLRVGRFDSE